MISIKPIEPKQTWPVRHRVLYPEKEYIEVNSLDDTQGYHFGLYENDTLISVVSWFRNDREAKLRKFGTVEEKQHLGYGSKLLQYVINFSKSAGVNRLLCNACETTTAFYRQFGFKKTNRIYKHNRQDFVELELSL